MSRAQQVRDFAAGKKSFSNDDLYRALGATSPQEKARLSWAVRDLVRSGVLARIGPRRCRLEKPAGRGREHPLQDKMWKSMTILRTFTRQDIAVMTDATLDYINKVVMRLMKEGAIRKAGMRKVGRAKMAVYQVMTKER